MNFVNFSMPLDASSYDFQWSFVQEITVEYGTSFENGKMEVVVTSISMGLILFSQLNNVKELKTQIEAAANHNAKVYWQINNTGNTVLNVHSINEHIQNAFTDSIY